MQGSDKKNQCRVVKESFHWGKAAHLLEVVSKLDHGRVLKHPARIDHQLAMLQRIDVTLDQQQIGARFHGKEPAARDVDAVRAFEVFDGRSRRCFELDHRLAILRGLWVNDDL